MISIPPPFPGVVVPVGGCSGSEVTAMDTYTSLRLIMYFKVSNKSLQQG